MNTITDTIKNLRIFVQDHIRGTAIGDLLVSLGKALGFNDLLTRILYAQDRKEPTKSMLYAEKYFSGHKKDLDFIAGLFADDFSSY